MSEWEPFQENEKYEETLHKTLANSRAAFYEKCQLLKARLKLPRT